MPKTNPVILTDQKRLSIGCRSFVNMGLVRRVRVHFALSKFHSDLHFSDGTVLVVAHTLDEIIGMVRAEEKNLAITKKASPAQ